MVTQATLRAKIKEDSPKETASYFGLIVEVIDRMPSLTLVRYRNREFVVGAEGFYCAGIPSMKLGVPLWNWCAVRVPCGLSPGSGYFQPCSINSFPPLSITSWSINSPSLNEPKS